MRFTLAVIERLDELHLGEVNAEKVDRLGACASLTGSVSKIPVVHRLDERSDQGECRSLFDGLMSFCLNAGAHDERGQSSCSSAQLRYLLWSAVSIREQMQNALFLSSGPADYQLSKGRIYP